MMSVLQTDDDAFRCERLNGDLLLGYGKRTPIDAVAVDFRIAHKQRHPQAFTGDRATRVEAKGLAVCASRRNNVGPGGVGAAAFGVPTGPAGVPT